MTSAIDAGILLDLAEFMGMLTKLGSIRRGIAGAGLALSVAFSGVTGNATTVEANSETQLTHSYAHPAASKRDAFLASKDKIVLYYAPDVKGIETEVSSLRQLGYNTDAYVSNDGSIEEGHVLGFVNRKPPLKMSQQDIYMGDTSLLTIEYDRQNLPKLRR